MKKMLDNDSLIDNRVSNTFHLFLLLFRPEERDEGPSIDQHMFDMDLQRPSSFIPGSGISG